MPRTSTKGDEIVEFMRRFIRENGYAPTVREIGAGVGLRSTASVSYHIERLRAEGRLTDSAAKCSRRAVAVTREDPGVRIPILGTVTAGIPILAVENREGTMVWDGDEDCFALRVRGDSMVGAGILSGDVVVVKPQPTADQGQIVVALLEDEATVKRLHRDAAGVWLLPENPAYEPIDGRRARILGVVKALARSF